MNYSCPLCGQSIATKLNHTWLLTCTDCNHPVFGLEDIKKENCFVPDDWSLIQIGSKLMYKEKLHTIIGRARLQMQSDFLNLWCATYNGNALWIGQSLEKIGFFDSSFSSYPEGKYKEPRAGLYIDFSETIKLKCELVEKCIDLRFEGELERLPFVQSKFLFIQASNVQGNTVLVFSEGKNKVEFLWGEMKIVGSGKFENTRQFNEWK
jgi:hypothetical protein